MRLYWFPTGAGGASHDTNRGRIQRQGYERHWQEGSNYTQSPNLSQEGIPTSPGSCTLCSIFSLYQTH